MWGGVFFFIGNMSSVIKSPCSLLLLLFIHCPLGRNVNIDNVSTSMRLDTVGTVSSPVEIFVDPESYKTFSNHEML